ncbi:hypothetical protein [Phytohabitans kaempferiae]|uniref:Uncharacterized protein n=1 Tax=Phytohabitans kaempferiae TaxID=1620943 RepID=A0ABV6MEZ1_9ACTN
MPLVFSARDSEVRVGNELLEGVRAIEYRSARERREVTAIGTDERIAVYYGARSVTGRLRVASTAKVLDGLLTGPAEFQVVATLRHGANQRTVAFDECWMESKQVELGDGGHQETVYQFSATRVREEDVPA